MGFRSNLDNVIPVVFRRTDTMLFEPRLSSPKRQETRAKNGWPWKVAGAPTKRWYKNTPAPSTTSWTVTMSGVWNETATVETSRPSSQSAKQLFFFFVKKFNHTNNVVRYRLSQCSAIAQFCGRFKLNIIVVALVDGSSCFFGLVWNQSTLQQKTMPYLYKKLSLEQNL